MGTILDHFQIVPFRNGHDRVHVRRMACEMNGNYRTRVFVHDLRDFARVDVYRRWIDINENRHGSDPQHSRCGRYETDRRHNNLVAGANSRG